jgi:hypothetical protein
LALVTVQGIQSCAIRAHFAGTGLVRGRGWLSVNAGVRPCGAAGGLYRLC